MIAVNIHVNIFYMNTSGFVQRTFRAGWLRAPALTLFGVLMGANLLFTLAGLVVDHRVITGAPAWLKPAKFAISTLIAAWSFAVCIASVTFWPRVRRVLDWLLAVGLAIEIVGIDMQAARGTSSHFNFHTPFDAIVFAVLGISIAVVWLSMLGLTGMLFRQQFADAAWGWSLRLGMVMALIGAGSGGLMTVPTPEQLAAAHHAKPPIIGAHTVGAPDGGRGLPITGWSADHGDLRIAHFAGMHGLQLLPLLAWFSRRRRQAIVFVAFISYLTLFGLILWQAFRGQSIAQPDALSVLSLALWLLASAAAWMWAIQEKKTV